MSQINWIHISDTHLGESSLDTDTVTTALISDVEQRADRIDPILQSIDFVFITGDLVAGGKEEEYEFAYGRLIEPIMQELGIDDPASSVFTVPGNHDVDRDKVSVIREAVRDTLNRDDSRDKIQAVLGDRNQLQPLLEPQESYFNFFSDTFVGVKLLSPCRHYVHRTSIDLGHIAIVGLNSAWLAYGGEDDRGELILGEPQVAAALERCEEGDIVISLLHHPFDWLNQDNPDSAHCRSRLMERSDLILHGHLHTPDLISTSSVSGDAVFIPAGAVLTTRGPSLAYNYTTLDLETGEGIVFFRRYSDTRRQWVRDVELTGDAAGGVRDFSVRPLESVSEAAPAVSAQLASVEEEEEGFLDWAIRIEDAGAEMIDLMQQIGTSAVRMGNELELSTDRMHSAGGDARRIRAIIRQLSRRVDEHAEEIRVCGSEMQSQWQSFYESFLPFVSLESEDIQRWVTRSGDPDQYAQQAIDAATTLETVIGQIGNLSSTIGQARLAVLQLRGADRSLNKSIRQLDAAYAQLVDILDDMRSDMAELGRLSREVPNILADALGSDSQSED